MFFHDKNMLFRILQRTALTKKTLQWWISTLETRLSLVIVHVFFSRTFSEKKYMQNTFAKNFVILLTWNVQSLRDLQRWPGWTSSPTLEESVDFVLESVSSLSLSFSTGSQSGFSGPLYHNWLEGLWHLMYLTKHFKIFMLWIRKISFHFTFCLLTFCSQVEMRWRGGQNKQRTCLSTFLQFPPPYYSSYTQN